MLTMVTENDRRAVWSETRGSPPTNFRTALKGDLHVHLNGAVPTQLMRSLLRQIEGQCLDDLHLKVKRPVSSMGEYLQPWKGFKSVPRDQSTLNKMVYEALRLRQKDHVCYVELRNSPFYIAALNRATLETALEWLVQAIDMACECLNATARLEHSSEKTKPIDARLVVSIAREDFRWENVNALEKALLSVCPKTSTIVGLDLSGDESLPIDKTVSSFFRRMHETLGLGVTIHAGESGNADNVLWALKECKAQRVAHALAAIKDERVLDAILNSSACIETCLTSNLRSGVLRDNLGRMLPLEAHPVKCFLERGIPVVLCTDNPAVHQASLSHEYSLLRRICTTEEVNRVYSNWARFAFAPLRSKSGFWAHSI
jgi:adenosine deaminase